MSAGLGIFLGSSLIGLVLLYGFTKDRWNWPSIIKRTVVWAVCLSAIAGVLLWASIWNDQRPRIQEELRNVHIGERFQDVVFRKGELERSEGAQADKPQAGDEQLFEIKEERLDVWVKNGQVATIRYGCEDGSDYTSINQITCGDSGEEILQRFPGKVRVLCYAGESIESNAGQYIRAYDVPRYGARYVLILNKVRFLTIAKPTDLQGFVGKTYDTCSDANIASKEVPNKPEPVLTKTDLRNEMARRKNLYSFLSKSPQALEVKAQLASGQINEKKARNALSSLLPKELRPVPPGGESEDWAARAGKK